VTIGGRIYTTGPDDYTTVHALQDHLALTPLSAWGTDYHPPAGVPVQPNVDAKTSVPEQVFAMSAQEFFGRLCRLLVDNPAHDADAPELERMSAIGIAPGAAFSTSGFDDATRAALDDGIRAADSGPSVRAWRRAYAPTRSGRVIASRSWR
jgi:hypothetical protein